MFSRLHCYSCHHHHPHFLPLAQCMCFLVLSASMDYPILCHLCGAHIVVILLESPCWVVIIAIEKQGPMPHRFHTQLEFV